MYMQRTILASVISALLLASASFAQQVKTDYDRSADFSRYKTYSWEKVQTQDPLWVDRIKQAVNTALTAKGWTPVDSGGSGDRDDSESAKSQHVLRRLRRRLALAWGRRIRRVNYNS
jgi:hypothetical protein